MNIIDNYNKQITIEFSAINNDPFGRHKISSVTNELGKLVFYEGDLQKLAQRIDKEIGEEWEGRDLSILINSEDLSIHLKSGKKQEELTRKAFWFDLFELQPRSLPIDERLKKLAIYEKELWKDIISMRGAEKVERRIQRSCKTPPALGVYSHVMNAHASPAKWKVRMGLLYLLESKDLPENWPKMTLLSKKQYLRRFLSRNVTSADILAFDRKLASGKWEFIRKGVLAHELGHLVGNCIHYAEKNGETDKSARDFEFKADKVAAFLPDTRIGEGLMLDLSIDKETTDINDIEEKGDKHPTLESRIERLKEYLAERVLEKLRN
ncbi:MAG: hypothetical protein JSR58_01965 [Verrucomicrobia bacterium]|nr:hypothetical protein [Verrucomicrobiota bacterium]